jgi:subtilisin family serine protease
VDLRGYDLSGLDLRNSLKDLSFADFDDKTIWPPADKMPAGFDWKQIMELGKDPGLNLRQLHQEGVTGKNIGIAVIDQTLLVDHLEFADRIQLYEETADIAGASWSMHGPAVASIAVGKNVGVAPEADLYFIATAMCSQGTYESNDFSCLAKSVLRIIEINSQLPSERKIRVLSRSVGWGSQSKGYAEITAAVQKAKDAGIFIICSSESDIYGLNFQAMGREPTADPNKFESYEPGLFWAKDFFQGHSLQNTLLVPMDSRTTASPTGVGDYVFYREGGWSWSIPYIAGMYALAAQVKPDITPDVFWSTALQTGRTIQIQHGGKTYSFGVILDPVALIHALQG